jgi:hypothetical protein
VLTRRSSKSGLSCSDLVTPPAEVVEEGSGSAGMRGWAVTCWAPMVTVAERRGRRSLRTLLMLSPARALGLAGDGQGGEHDGQVSLMLSSRR